MKNTKDDRRSKRTRQMLGSALVELMLERRYDTITVQDILDRANVGRSTFYAHYTDKEDLMISEIARVIHELERFTAGHTAGGLLPSLAFFRHVKDMRRLVHAFVWGPSSDLLLRDFQAQLSKTVAQNLQALAGNEAAFALPLPVIANFVAGTLMMLLQWWFEEDLQHTPEQMDAMFTQLVMPAVHGLMA